MPEITRASRRELTATEILEIVEHGGRVIIEVSVLGKRMDVVIREQDGTYYCDTPMKLMTHTTREALEHCLVKFRLATNEADDRQLADSESGSEAATEAETEVGVSG